ncbi:hypothetical protein D3C86_1278240 [compost metagenome]
MGVDVDRTCFQAWNQAVHLAQVVGIQCRRQAVGRVVGQGQRVFFIVERCGDQHRAEDLFLDNAHVIAAIGEDGRLDEEARAIDRLAAVDQFGAFGLAGFDVLGHALLLQRRDQRADEAVRVQARGHFQGARVGDQLTQEFVVDTAMNIGPCTGVAYLPGVEKHAVGDRLGGGRDVGVGADDDR